nr:Large proline-rich protein like [Ipomoea batatas]
MDKNGNDEIKNSESNDAIEIKIRKMFCLQTPTLRIDKRVGVGAVKEEVRLVTGVLAEHQHLIFRGKALRDDKQLSEMWKMVTLCI